MQIFGGGDELAKKKDIISPNLIAGSKDFTGSKWVNIPENVQKDEYLDFTAICVNWAWNGISQYIAVNKGETFTASMYVKAKAGSTVSWYINLLGDEAGYKQADTNPANKTINGTGNWQKTSITFTVTGDSGAIRPRIESDGNSPCWIAGMKLERGTHATPWCPAYEDYAMKSDLSTKTIIQDVDINTLTTEGNFFVESNNMDHFPAEYQNQWYFLNVVNPGGDVNRIKQTVTPDHSEKGWTMTRTGSYNADTHIVEWESWLISDFAKGKLLKSN